MTPVSWAIFCLYFIVKMPNLLDIRLGRPKRPHYLVHFRLVVWRISVWLFGAFPFGYLAHLEGRVCAKDCPNDSTCELIPIQLHTDS